MATSSNDLRVVYLSQMSLRFFDFQKLAVILSPYVSDPRVSDMVGDVSRCTQTVLKSTKPQTHMELVYSPQTSFALGPIVTVLLNHLIQNLIIL